MLAPSTMHGRDRAYGLRDAPLDELTRPEIEAWLGTLLTKARHRTPPGRGLLDEALTEFDRLPEVAGRVAGAITAPARRGREPA
jgi:hypothetical protein